MTGAVRLEQFRGQVAAFNGTCPAGWNEMTALEGRMIVGLVSGGTLAESVGTALTNGAVRLGGTAHNHSVEYRRENGTSSSSIVVHDGGVALNRRHDFAGSQTIDAERVASGGSIQLGSSANQPTPAPYVQLQYCEYQP